jgi:hypothetical protein
MERDVRITAAGLDLAGELDEGDAPLEALLAVKVLASDGGADWKILATPGLHAVEAMGAARFAAGYLERSAFGDDED